MATRGYFKVKSIEENTNDPYIGNDDILMEAYHDGYLDDMLNEVLNIPVVMGAKIANASIRPFLARHIIEAVQEGNERGFPRGNNSYEEILAMNHSMGMVDMTWSSISEFIHITTPLKYNRIEPGVNRYGSPIVMEDAYFTVEHEDAHNRNNDNLKIVFEELDNEDLELVESIVEEYNEKMVHEENKITFDEDNLTITMCFGKIMCESIDQHTRMRVGV
jgi:hypothetical protein